MKTFNPDFVWGAASSAYQVEGATTTDGRGPSIWDAFSSIPGKTYHNQNADIACDHYNRWQEDVAIMKEMGLKAYRFSISWSRIFPTGRGEVNEKGVAFYNNLIDELIKNDITPWVTLFHWDFPLALQMEMDGLLNPAIADEFANYAKLCFARFGDRVTHWITLNEPWCSAMLGHGMGSKAPGRVSKDEPYIAAHNLLRAHGKMVDIYRREFQPTQKGMIGIANNCDWREPKTDSELDKKAAERALEFFVSWFADPIYLGDYPASMRERLGERLPTFSDEDIALIKNSSDFFGLNHYTTMLAEQTHEGEVVEDTIRGNGGISEDQMVTLSKDPSWEQTDMEWSIVPWGCKKLLLWLSERYNYPDIYITENGCALPDEDDVNIAINDTRRVDFYRGYIDACHQAIEAGVKLKGYFAWTLMDNYEWEEGYTKRFGLNHVDFTTGKRTPKQSAIWYSTLIKDGGF